MKCIGLSKQQTEAILAHPGSPVNRAQLLNLTGQYPSANITPSEAELMLEHVYCQRYGGQLSEGTEESRRKDEWGEERIHFGGVPFRSGEDEDNDEDEEEEEEDDEEKTEEIVVTNDVTCPGMKFTCREKKQVEEVTLRLGNGFIPALAIEEAFRQIQWQNYGTDVESYFSALTIKCIEIAKHRINEGDVPVDPEDLPVIKTSLDPDSHGESEFEDVTVSVENLDELKKALRKRIATDQATTDSTFASWIREHTPEVEGA